MYTINKNPEQGSRDIHSQSGCHGKSEQSRAGWVGMAGNQGTNDLQRVFQISKTALSHRHEPPQKVSRSWHAGKVRLQSSYRIHHPQAMSIYLFAAIYPAKMAGNRFSDNVKHRILPFILPKWQKGKVGGCLDPRICHSGRSGSTAHSIVKPLNVCR